MKRALLIALVALAALAAAASVHVRLAPIDAAAEHVDPMTVVRATTPNAALIAPAGAASAPDRAAPVFARTPEALMAAFDRIAMAAPRVTRLAGSPAELHATYLQRSAIMGYPDFISVRALPAEGGATLAIYSRSRFGFGDFGVNAARASAWLDALERDGG